MQIKGIMLFTIDKPIYLIICLLIPFIWLLMKRSSVRERLSKKEMALSAIRSFLILVLGLALSDPKLLSHSDQVNIFFCLDVSESIPGYQRQKAEAFIKNATSGMQLEDQAGFIVFGKHARLEESLRANLDTLSIK